MCSVRTRLGFKACQIFVTFLSLPVFALLGQMENMVEPGKLSMVRFISLITQSLKDFCSVTIFSRGIGYGHWIVFQDKILSQSHIQTKPKYFSNCKYTDRINITQICDCYIFLVRTTEQVYLSLLCWTMLWMKGIFSLYIS